MEKKMPAWCNVENDKDVIYNKNKNIKKWMREGEDYVLDLTLDQK
jgi:hypothetical protein